MRLAAVLLALWALPLQASEVTVPNTFQAGTPAVADEVNANFSAVETAVNGNAADIGNLQTAVASLQAVVAQHGTDIGQLQSDLAAANSAIQQLIAAGSPVLESQSYYADGLFFLDSSGNFIIANESVNPTGFAYYPLPGLDPVTINIPDDGTTVLLQTQGEAYITSFGAWSQLFVGLSIDGAVPTLGAEVILRMVSDDTKSSGGAHWDILYPVVLDSGDHTISVEVHTASTIESSITIDAQEGRAKLVVTRLGNP